jgi:aspartyl-tRNA(Asn)/glutamyl-tRNA(Gln) amidotransferase subunit B
MEKGMIRFEPSVSVRPVGSTVMNPRHEIKNLNSFSALASALKYDIGKQIETYRAGSIVSQQTMRWNEAQGATYPSRAKEHAQDYRYFPEPDLPVLEISREWVEELRARLPELPTAKRARFLAEYGLSEYDADLLVGDRTVADYFEQVVEAGAAPKKAANWITSELFRLMKTADWEMGKSGVPAEALAELIRLVEEGRINQSTGKDVLTEMLTTGRRAPDIVRERGLAQISDAERLGETVTHTLDENPEQVQEYLMGKEQVLGWFIGQVMRATRGKANPQLARELIREQLEGKRG